MSNSPAKNSILKKIRMALAKPTPLPFPGSEGSGEVVQPLQEDLMVTFAEQFTQLQGKFVYCLDPREMLVHFKELCVRNGWTKIYCNEAPWQRLLPEEWLTDDLAGCDASVTGCEFLIARTGSMVLSATHQGRLPSVYAPVHVCMATASQLVYDLRDGLVGIRERYGSKPPSLITFATGPSRTADIEKTLVVGVHGPKEVYCFVIEDQ